MVKEPSDENNVKLLQISSSEKSRPVFSFQKFAKTSHPSGGLDLPRRSAYFRGEQTFSVTCQKKEWSQSTQLANIWKSLHRITRPSAVSRGPKGRRGCFDTTVAVDNNQKNWLRETEKSRGKRRLVGERHCAERAARPSC